MAVNFAAPPAVLDTTQHHFPSHYSSRHMQEPSPDSSENSTPTSFSPTSPQSSYPQHNAHPSRQLRAPKKPIYVPAVLRPTERPSRCSPPKADGATSPAAPLTPPSSSGANSQQVTPCDDDDETVLRKFLGGGAPSAGVTRIVTDEWNENKIEPVTGSPTKDHWKPDEAATACDFASCQLSFNIIRRRHHCRRCGNIFCADHARAQVPLDQHARFHPRGFSGRACDACAKDFSFWRKAMRLKRRANSIETISSPPATSSGTSTPDASIPISSQDQGASTGTAESAGVAEADGQKNDGRGRGSGEMVASSFIGSLGNWSTF